MLPLGSECPPAYDQRRRRKCFRHHSSTTEYASQGDMPTSHSQHEVVCWLEGCKDMTQYKGHVFRAQLNMSIAVMHTNQVTVRARQDYIYPGLGLKDLEAMFSPEAIWNSTVPMVTTSTRNRFFLQVLRCKMEPASCSDTYRHIPQVRLVQNVLLDRNNRRPAHVSNRTIK